MQGSSLCTPPRLNMDILFYVDIYVYFAMVALLILFWTSGFLRVLSSEACGVGDHDLRSSPLQLAVIVTFLLFC
jgi:hypothetical protein